MVIDFWPLDSHPDFLDMQNYTFSESSRRSNNLSPFSLKSNQLEYLTPVQKVSDL